MRCTWHIQNAMLLWTLSRKGETQHHVTEARLKTGFRGRQVQHSQDLDGTTCPVLMSPIKIRLYPKTNGFLEVSVKNVGEEEEEREEKKEEKVDEEEEEEEEGSTLVCEAGSAKRSCGGRFMEVGGWELGKEKNSFLNYNVSCILTLPPYQRQGYGRLLIDFRAAAAAAAAAAESATPGVSPHRSTTYPHHTASAQALRIRTNAQSNTEGRPLRVYYAFTRSYHQSQLVSIRRHSYNVENELNCLSISCDRQALFMKRTCYTRITVCVCLWNPDFTEQLLLLASLARDKPFLYTTLFFKMKEHKFCYLLTRVEKKIGSPEKPLSDLGLISYRSYWKDVLLQYLCNFGGKELSVKDISKEMAIDSYDIVSTLQALGMMKYWKGKHIILKKQDVIDDYKERVKRRGLVYKEIDPECLKWNPFQPPKTPSASN
ncbi:Histone acetyltransferase MYST2 [Vespula squamosa]|uniref:Histone acetyltransferase n=1 Tax=Vespula squamosa TaxID=30214 RepID=A0ABD1ZUN8_VESSQ